MQGSIRSLPAQARDREPRDWATRSTSPKPQIDALSDPEIDVLLEIWEMLRLAPGNGRDYRQDQILVLSAW
ncbi:hypothetical protein GCM10020219_034300 [Nonomuraea dietziae]